jgi:hypothetical protein
MKHPETILPTRRTTRGVDVSVSVHQLQRANRARPYRTRIIWNDFYTRRIGSLILRRATVHEVEAIFGGAHSFAARPDGFMWYYALQVYNPFEERGGRD